MKDIGKLTGAFPGKWQNESQVQPQNTWLSLLGIPNNTQVKFFDMINKRREGMGLPVRKFSAQQQAGSAAPRQALQASQHINFLPGGYGGNQQIRGGMMGLNYRLRG
jgi:hypothetical protein